MITVHYLRNSRSQRIVWLAEELGINYDICFHERDPKTNLAPNSLKSIHPLGRAPIVTDGNQTLTESAAIIEYLIEKYDTQSSFKLSEADSDSVDTLHQYRFWLHFAEGSLMPAMVATLVLDKGSTKVSFPFSVVTDKFVEGVKDAYFASNLATSLAFVEKHLAANNGFVENKLTAVDFQMLFPLEAIVATGQASNLPAITAYVKRMHQREAYQQALKKVGEYAYATSV